MHASTDTYAIVRDAILNRKTIIGRYGGFLRELCPWAVGTRQGVPRALFYQRAGQTSRGSVITDSPSNWRCMDLDRLEILEIVDRGWTGITPHRKPSSCLDVIDVDLSPRSSG